MPSRRRVLIVDDEKLIATTLQAILERQDGTSIRCAYSYDESLSLLERERWDVAFIDLKLGVGLGGVELAKRAVQLGVRVVAMTGQRVLPEGLEGAALLLKPFSVDAVRMVFDLIADSAKQAPQPAPSRSC